MAIVGHRKCCASSQTIKRSSFSRRLSCELHSGWKNEMQFALSVHPKYEHAQHGHEGASAAAIGNVQALKIVQLARCTAANFRNRVNTRSGALAKLARPLRYVPPRCLPHISANEMEVPCVSTASYR